MRSLLIISLLVAPNFLLAQGAFLDKATSGVGVGFAHTMTDNFDITGLNFGYSFNGNVDLALAYSRTSREETKINSVSPYLTFHATNESPVSSAITVAYLYGVSEPSSVSLNGVAFGCDVFGQFLKTKDFYLVPSIGINYSVVIATKKHGSVSVPKNNTTFTFGLSTVLRPESEGRIVVNTAFVTDDENESFILGLEFVVPIKRSSN